MKELSYCGVPFVKATLDMKCITILLVLKLTYLYKYFEEDLRNSLARDTYSYTISLVLRNIENNVRDQITNSRSLDHDSHSHPKHK